MDGSSYNGWINLIFALGGLLLGMDGWIMEFKSCHSCEDLAQDRVVKKNIFFF